MPGSVRAREAGKGESPGLRDRQISVTWAVVSHLTIRLPSEGYHVLAKTSLSSSSPEYVLFSTGGSKDNKTEHIWWWVV